MMIFKETILPVSAAVLLGLLFADTGTTVIGAHKAEDKGEADVDEPGVDVWVTEVENDVREPGIATFGAALEADATAAAAVVSVEANVEMVGSGDTEREDTGWVSPPLLETDIWGTTAVSSTCRGDKTASWLLRAADVAVAGRSLDPLDGLSSFCVPELDAASV